MQIYIIHTPEEPSWLFELSQKRLLNAPIATRPQDWEETARVLLFGEAHRGKA